MSEARDIAVDGAVIIGGGLPVYSFVKDSVEAAARNKGASEGDAKVLGIVAGACASFVTVFTVGTA